MAQAPLTIKLRCTSWKQLANIYRRDLTRSALFLKSTKKLPPIGVEVRVNLTLPSDTLIILKGSVGEHVGEGGLEGRGPGVDIKLDNIPQSAMWLIESALSSVEKEGSQVAPLPRAAAERAKKQSVAPQAPVRQRAPTAPPSHPIDDASLDDGADIVAAEDELVTALTKELASLRKLNAFQMLGVGYETSDEAVRAAFGALTKRYHPDRFARYQSIPARDLASEIFILIRDAYRKVGDTRNRARTLASLQQERPTGPIPPRRAPSQPPTPNAAATPRTRAPAAPAASRTPAPRPRAPTAPPARQTPLVQARATTPSPAPPVRSRATTPLPVVEPARPGVSKGQRATAELPTTPPRAAPSASRSEGVERANELLEEGRYEDAAAIFRLATRRDPTSTSARAGLELAEGLRSMAQRDRLEAAQRFEAVLELDPTNERAARELAEMRRQATNDRKGLLSRLLGKGE